MVQVKIIYGYEITTDDVYDIFPVEEHPYIYDENDILFKDPIRILNYLVPIIENNIDHEDISVFTTDALYNVKSGRGDKLPFDAFYLKNFRYDISSKDKDNIILKSTIVVGIEIGQLNARMSGNISIPTIFDKERDIVENNIDIDFKYVNPAFQAYVNYTNNYSEYDSSTDSENEDENCYLNRIF